MAKRFNPNTWANLKVKVGGTLYHLHGVKKTKTEAEKVARYVRTKGWLVVVKGSRVFGWGVYQALAHKK